MADYEDDPEEQLEQFILQNQLDENCSTALRASLCENELSIIWKKNLYEIVKTLFQ